MHHPTNRPIIDANRKLGFREADFPRPELALFHLLIDASQQRRGYGRAALRQVVGLASQLENCGRLRLTVHPENEAAIGLYASEGFTQDGIDADGELCMSVATR